MSETEMANLAYDEGAMVQVAEAIYCAAHPELASVWPFECSETRRYYMDLASAAFLVSLALMDERK